MYLYLSTATMKLIALICIFVAEVRYTQKKTEYYVQIYVSNVNLKRFVKNKLVKFKVHNILFVYLYI